MRLLCIGEAMAELRPEGDSFAVGYAGDTFNTAVYCRRLMPAGGSVGYMTHVGRDPLSDRFLDLARSEDIDTSRIRRDTARNIGIYTVSTDDVGERSFHYWRGDSAARQLFVDPDSRGALEGAEILYLSAITLAILSPAARETLFGGLVAQRAKGAKLAFDSNYRPRLWDDLATAQHWVRRLWSVTDIALPSLDDEQALFGDPDAAAVAARLYGWGCRIGSVKCGMLGPLPIDAAMAEMQPFPAAPHVVDTTAAGDSFNGGYLAALLLKRDERVAMHWGHMIARAVVGQRGAIVRDLPDLAGVGFSPAAPLPGAGPGPGNEGRG